MAIKCPKCGGLIPDVVLGRKPSHGCEDHIKPKIDVKGPARWYR